MEFTGVFAALLLASFVLRVGVSRLRPRPARLAGCAWLMLAAWLFLLGAFAGAVNIAAFVFLWPIAGGLVLVALLLFLRPARVALAVSALLAAALLVLSGVAAATSSAAFQFSLWLAAGLSAVILLFSVVGLRSGGHATARPSIDGDDDPPDGGGSHVIAAP